VKKRPSTYALLGVLPHAVGYVGGPLAVSRLGRRHGWRRGRPGPINRAGVVPLALGAGLIGWAISSHYEAGPDELNATLVPTYLVQRGAYRVTRNPLYLGGASMQLGWAILLGSAPVAAVGAGFVVGMDRLGIPFEERMLKRRFGETYDSYRRDVPRWFSRRSLTRLS